MDTAIEYPVPDQLIFDIWTLWRSECPDVKNYKWRLNPVWHRMLYNCTHMSAVGVKGLSSCLPDCRSMPFGSPLIQFTLQALHTVVWVYCTCRSIMGTKSNETPSHGVGQTHRLPEADPQRHARRARYLVHTNRLRSHRDEVCAIVMTSWKAQNSERNVEH